VKHGRYSKLNQVRLRDLIAAHENDPNPLDLLPELGLMRALLDDALSRYDPDRNRKGGSRVPDTMDVARIVSDVTKIVERIERIRSTNVLTWPELRALLDGMVGVLRRHVTDPDTLEAIRCEWMALRVVCSNPPEGGGNHAG
jgi:hypothetical protein